MFELKKNDPLALTLIVQMYRPIAIGHKQNMNSDWNIVYAQYGCDIYNNTRLSFGVFFSIYPTYIRINTRRTCKRKTHK